MPPAAIYLDHAATAPVLPEVRAAVQAALADWANPSSVHAAGRRARAALERARAEIGEALGWPHEVIFTGSATEALALAWQASHGTRKFASAVEHTAVLRHAGDAVLAVDGEGRVDPAALPTADLVAVQQVNNETGVIQPLAAIGAALRASATPWLADCAQGAGKLALPDADLVAIAGHKLGAPPGIGALLARDLALIAPSGGQERGYRPGTENLPYILGLAVAVKAGRDWLAEAAALRGWWEDEWRALGGLVVGEGTARLATIGAYRLPGLAATAMLIRADAAGIAISAGSACSSGSIRASHVLGAMGLGESEAREVFRVSIGRGTTRAQLEALLAVAAPLASAKGAA
ncbi:MAG: aminotransferase class V-fold PLP-dependent enzyme [Sphingomonadales bacterium]|nr:aminotransferase class V-fold PLP-dependent enzyme [Sphingomonadales bacterium]